MRLPHITSPFTSIYAEAQATPEIKKSMRSVLIGNMCGNLHCIICTSGTTAMIQLANFLGAGDFEYGFITAIPLAAAIFQIPYSILVNRTQKRKKYMLTVGLFSRILWLFFGIVPVLMPENPEWLRLWTIITLLGVSSVCGNIINVCWMPWIADLIPLNIRGRWMSWRDAINSLLGVIFGLIISYILDSVPGAAKFAIVFTIGAVFGILDMCSFIFVKEVYSAPPTKSNLFQTMSAVFRDKPFMRFTIFWTAWCFTANMSGMYITRYAMNEMGLTNMQVTIYGSIAASAVTMFVISRWGRILDHFGCKPVMLVSGIVAALTQGFFLFSTYGQIWPMLVHNVIGAAFWSASNLAATNMQLSYSPDDKRASYIALFSCATSLCGSFLGVLLGGAMLDWMEVIGISGNTGFDRYKILILVAITLRFLIVIVLVPKMSNDRDGTTKDMMRSFANIFKRSAV